MVVKYFCVVVENSRFMFSFSFMEWHISGDVS